MPHGADSSNICCNAVYGIGVEDSNNGGTPARAGPVKRARASTPAQPTTAMGETGAGRGGAAGGVQPRHTGVTDEPSGDGEPVLLRRRVELTPGRSAAAHDTMGCRVDAHRLHRCEVDHQTVVAHRESRVVVPATS